MRDRARQLAMAEAKSHRASPEELREASKRLKEIEDELSQRDLLPETKQGRNANGATHGCSASARCAMSSRASVRSKS